MAATKALKFRAPMLARSFDQPIEFPCYAQPKIDGIRCITNGQRFWSRNGKLFPQQNLAHLQMPMLPYLVDGELTVSGGMGDFEQVASVVKRGGHADSRNICFNVFDIITDEPYAARNLELKKLFETRHIKVLGKKWHRLTTKKIDSEEQLLKFYKSCLVLGHEGVMIRTVFGKYVSGRTRDLLKWKPLLDAEFEIVEVKEAKGKDKGTPIFICRMNDDTNDPEEAGTFRVRPMGKMKQRRQMWKDRDDLLGQMLTVEYQNLTRYGKPRFPRAKVLRDYE